MIERASVPKVVAAVAAVLLLLVAPSLGQCGPPDYTCTTNSTAVVQTPAPPFTSTTPTATTCLGQCLNSVGYDTSLNPLGRNPILRGSDGTVLDGVPINSSCSGGDNDEIWSCTGRQDTSAACRNATVYFLSACTGGAAYVAGIRFDLGIPTVVAPFPPHASGTYHPVPGSNIHFSNQDPTVAFDEVVVAGVPIAHKITYAWDGTVGHYPTFSVATLYSPATDCAVWPAGYNEGWTGPLSHDVNDNIFAWASTNVAGVALGVDTIGVTNGSAAFTITGPALPTDGSMIHAMVIIAGEANVYAIATLNGGGTAGTLDQIYAGTTNGAASLKINGGQGTGHYIFAFQLSPAACGVWDTFAGTFTGAGAWAGEAARSIRAALACTCMTPISFRTGNTFMRAAPEAEPTAASENISGR